MNGSKEIKPNKNLKKTKLLNDKLYLLINLALDHAMPQVNIASNINMYNEILFLFIIKT